VVVLAPVRGIGLCSDWVSAMGSESESSDLAVAMDSDWGSMVMDRENVTNSHRTAVNDLTVVK
jgi:hypothetical protein